MTNVLSTFCSCAFDIYSTDRKIQSCARGKCLIEHWEWPDSTLRQIILEWPDFKEDISYKVLGLFPEVIYPQSKTTHLVPVLSQKWDSTNIDKAIYLSNIFRDICTFSVNR